ncbi:MAG: response regulator [Selenomonadaceae bacterium]|nr:response regulator [Selenomonadaceae bacterium]MBO6303994.1 response regulator [Selenomonadaceae bacterium]MBP3722971.1 response regulator [Selenomonadaceae bacterium]
MRTLVAEDDIVSQKILEQFLSCYGEVVVASDGMEALNILMDNIKAGENFDLLCLDIMMPEVSGIEVLKVIRELEKEMGVTEEARLPIIMTTALSDMEYVDEAFDIGCDGYAAKPIDLDHIEELLRDLELI